ncbi:hypothetical protein J3R30DRAFT_3288342 [Lentinula aciculospora]|uniref:Transmembrane protein n=1 Tax=Lentinula aciculospora TaxID=153920 RepID=A0A9W9AEA9_9AGAR|nr:hypothetical protein J3R30DRAFT_3288342 [Lentinula aciculospora]
MSSSTSVEPQVASAVIINDSHLQHNSTAVSHIIEGSHLPLDPTIIIRDVPPTLDAVDNIFGHHCQEQEQEETLPPYLEEPPAYTSSGSNEPVTLAMYLFKFGFLFPPFWIIGALILLSPLRQPESTPSSVWLPEKTESEREEIIQKMRKAEVRWAKRCSIALCILLLLVVVGALAVWAVLRA